MFDVYNVFNGNAPLGVTTRYTPDNRYLRPSVVMGGRLFKLTGEVNF